MAFVVMGTITPFSWDSTYDKGCAFIQNSLQRLAFQAHNVWLGLFGETSEYNSSKTQRTCPEAGLPSELRSFLGKSLVSTSHMGTLGATPCPVLWEKQHDPGSFMLSF